LDIDEAALSEVFEEVDALGVNAYFYAAVADLNAAHAIAFDALNQLVNIHVYAFYDKDFEVEDEQNLYDIIELNMIHKLEGDVLSALHNWITDMVMLLATGAVSLDGFIDAAREESG